MCTTRIYVTTDNHHMHKCPDWPARCSNSCDHYHTLTQSTVDTCGEGPECPETLVGVPGEEEEEGHARTHERCIVRAYDSHV